MRWGTAADGLRARWVKRRGELAYWRGRVAAEGTLANFWYERAWTEAVGIDRARYTGARVLDVGCGPRGSLEWATDAARRVGADPLAARYARLHAQPQRMEYVSARAESLPFADASFDVVGCFNALDHVEDVDRAIAELVRVLAPGGDLLVVVDIGHEATELEPWTFGWDLVERFPAGLERARVRHLERVDEAIYVTLEQDVPFDHARDDGRRGVLAARLRRSGP